MSNGVLTALIAFAGAVIVPVITAALTGLDGWLKDRRGSRDRDQERHRVLTQVREEIDVIGAWVKAYDLVAPPELRSQVSSRAQNELELAYARLAKSLEDSRNAEPRKTLGEYLKKTFRRYLKGPHPQPSRYPIWRKTYLWLISITGLIGCVVTLASALAPSPGHNYQPVGGVLGTLGLLFSGWIGWYAHRVPLDAAKDTKPQEAGEESSTTSPT